MTRSLLHSTAGEGPNRYSYRRASLEPGHLRMIPRRQSSLHSDDHSKVWIRCWRPPLNIALLRIRQEGWPFLEFQAAKRVLVR